MQPKALQSLKRALQPAVTGISLSWDLPPGMEAALLGRGPEVIFPGQRCLIYAQLRGQPQPPDTAVGGVSLQYRIQDQTYKETLQFPLQPQDGDRLPVHRLAAKSLLLELEGAVDTGSEGDRRRVLETSLSSGVVCSLTAYVGVDTERGQPVQGPLVRRDIPLAAFGAAPRMSMAQAQGLSSVSVDCAMAFNLQVKSCRPPVLLRDTHPQSSPRAVGALFSPGTAPPGSLAMLKGSCGSPRHKVRKSCTLSAPPETASKEERAPEVSPLLRLVSLQNADGSWDLDPRLAAALGVSETDARGRMPSQDVPPSIWATVLAVVWLHGRAVGQRDEWELLEAKAVGWVRGQAGPQLSECLEAANTLLGCSVGPAVFGL
ncbi:von Willebrand factor A domain-containing protein 5A-like [Mauremys mutica]|uniref:von Willebrand factor A domain-containing protein 5A-like n=1 Tax=Mauremys mutica TaxID=74926 RepID=UPI001D168B34|nr:von Willebrand factor A domain-containing protein 5A-like [Mauremys mutica]